MNRDWISKALDAVDEEYIAQCMTYRGKANGHASERNKKMGKYEPMKKPAFAGRKLFALILAACLVFALAITAYAANFLGIREMFYRQLPEPAETYIQSHTEAAQEEDWSCQITESLCDVNRVMVTVNVSGGDKYILIPEDAIGKEDKVGIIGLAGDQTLAEYAAAQDKQLLHINGTLRRSEGLDIFMESFDTQSTAPGEMTLLVDANLTGGGEVPDQAVCTVIGWIDGEEKPMEMEIPFALTQMPTDGEVFVPVDPNAVPGITVGEATVTKSPLGISVRYMDTETQEGARNDLMVKSIDELTGYEGGGWVLENDGNWYFQLSMGQGTVTDTLTVHYYDWNDQPVGTIVFKKK